MTRREPRDRAASIKARLLAYAKANGEDFNQVLVRFATDRLLYRLAESPHKDRFVLKGAMLFLGWIGALHRPTRDADLLARTQNDEHQIALIFRDLCKESAADDGLIFVPDSVSVTEIRDETDYGGQRVELVARLGTAEIHLQVDIGFGDAITPGPQTVELPALLGLPPARLIGYPRETVIAEKLEAMVKFGRANSRMKDFYDLVELARRFAFDGDALRSAVEATFTRRGTPVPVGPPVALTEEFAADKSKQAQWRAFLRRSDLASSGLALPEVLREIGEFAGPLLETVAAGRPFTGRWPNGGPWR